MIADHRSVTVMSCCQATRDPYYLDVGRTVVNSLQHYARVPCGFAALKDLRTNTHEDRLGCTVFIILIPHFSSPSSY